jgi:hypothetical protein
MILSTFDLSLEELSSSRSNKSLKIKLLDV